MTLRIPGGFSIRPLRPIPKDSNGSVFVRIYLELRRILHYIFVITESHRMVIL
jgi:hypothetical protein